MTVVRRQPWHSASKVLKAVLLFIILCGVLTPPQMALADEATSAQTAGDDQPSFIAQVFSNLLNSKGLMELLGRPEYTVAAFVTLNIIVFVETGLLIGFFLPGDSLLVTAGLICSSPTCGWNVGFLILTLCISAIVGDSVGYSIGYKTGPKIFCKEKSFFFHKDHLLKAQHFYEKHGGKTIIIARFMPLLRTFAPVVAGVGKMNYRRFLSYNIFGGIGWVCSMVLLGYFLPTVINPIFQPIFGPEFLVQEHIEKVIILVVLLSIAPAIFVWLRSRFKKETLPCEPAIAEAK